AAKTALGAGDGAAALAALDEHARDFSRGQLIEEAAVQRVEALCALGRAREAAVAANAHRAGWPRSALHHRIERSCVKEVHP
ncbi:MAG: hypothetical protein KIT31_20350, partial [Deltaproteobacteria bacterium]|nr:hypothetical protein [Deltaproteobacteria bacterium]